MSVWTDEISSHDYWLSFLRYSVEVGDMTMEDLLYCLEKPWKWKKEFALYLLQEAEEVAEERKQRNA